MVSVPKISILLLGLIAFAESGAATGNRILRRLTLDFTGKLPTTEQRTAFADQDLNQTIESLLASESANAQIAEMHTWVWNLEEARQKSLTRFQDDGSTILASSYDTAAKSKIRQEPTLQIRYLLDQGLTFPELFTGNQLAAATSNLSLWGMTADSDLWSTDGNYGLATHDADKPHLGLLLSPGLQANFAQENRSDLQPKLFQMLQTFHCYSYFDYTAHRFHTLKETDLTQDLRTYAASQKNCASCHLHTSTLATPLAGLHNGTTFADWLTYSGPNDESGTYVGHSFASLTEWGTMFSTDPRTKLCEFRGLIRSLRQMPFDDGLDYQTLLLASHVYHKYDLQLKPAIKIMALSGSYQQQPVLNSAKEKARFRNTGIRYLSRRHWESLADQLRPDHSTITFDEALDAGLTDDLEKDRRIPNSPYWYAVNRTARQLASAIVNTELTNTATAEDRSTLTFLGEGIEINLTDAQVKTHLQTLWRMLTDNNPQSDDTNVTRLLAVWKAVAGETPTESSVKNAWETVLLGIFLSLDFLTL